MESAPATVSLDMPHGWRSACGLDTTSDPNKFAATSVELLLDSPIVVGNFRQWNFTIDGIAHQVAYLDQAQSAKFDNDALVTDLQKLVRQAFELAGKPPYKHFTFIFLDGAE
jgi:predicted metalloprotease with PDZ domain